MKTIETVSERKFKAGYVERLELVEENGKEKRVKRCYNREGDLIGDTKLTWHLFKKMKVYPELAESGDKICSVGFNSNNKRWYAWSPDGEIFESFGVGDIVDGDIAEPKNADSAEKELKEKYKNTGVFKELTIERFDDRVVATYDRLHVKYDGRSVPAKSLARETDTVYLGGSNESKVIGTLDDARNEAVKFAKGKRL